MNPNLVLARKTCAGHTTDTRMVYIFQACNKTLRSPPSIRCLLLVDHSGSMLFVYLSLPRASLIMVLAIGDWINDLWSASPHPHLCEFVAVGQLIIPLVGHMEEANGLTGYPWLLKVVDHVPCGCNCQHHLSAVWRFYKRLAPCTMPSLEFGIISAIPSKPWP